ncbi:MAG: arylsulfotransferase family protein [Gaiellaceae bacterium]
MRPQPSPFDADALRLVGDVPTTRAEFVRRASGSALGLALLGGVGFDGLRLLGAEDADAATLRSPNDVRRFHSRPDLRPPRLTILRAGKSDHCLFLSPSSGAGQRGALILDEKGEVVWFRPTRPDTVMNFRTALYKGEPVLTWWQGRAARGLGVGFHVIVDSTYREVARLPAGAGRQSDLHEFTLTPRGTAIVTSYEIRTANLSRVGGPSSGKVIGSIVQEIAIPSARVLFEWRSLDHVSVDEAYNMYNGHAFDYFHINSVDVDADGNLLVSARNTWAVYKVDSETGRVLWRLGGKRSDFQMGPGTRFAWQHDARHHDEGRLISIFDNSAAPPVASQSRVLVIELDRRQRRARLVRQYTHPRRLLSPFMGNAQVLPNGNVVVGWGGLPYITEFRRGGGVHFDARLPAGGQNYRAFRLPWQGRPHRPPRLVAHTASGRRRLYVSWNGATEVAAWRLEAGPARNDLQTVLTRPKQSFETSLPVPRRDGFATVVALGPRGQILGRSNTIRL